MPVKIFSRETNAREESLTVNDDMTVTYHSERSGWPMMRKGIGARDTKMAVDEAKAKWPGYAEDIEKALATNRDKHSE